MWPFTKSRLPLERFADVDTWSVGQGTINSSPVIARVNSAAEAFVGHPGLSSRFSLMLPWLIPHRGGMPDPEESSAAGNLEDTLISTLQGSDQGLLVAIVTSGERREFVGYVRDASWVRSKLEDLKRENPRLEYSIVEDPTWVVYRQLRL